MKKLYSSKFTQFLFCIFLLFNAQSSAKELINKYSSIKTKDNSIILNLSEFNYNENIYLTLKTETVCEDYLEYKFYDDINDIFNENNDEKMKIRPYLKEKYNILEIKTYFSWYYTIMKRKNSFNDLKENYLLLIFKCESEIEVINSKDKHENISIYIQLFYFYSSILVIFFLIKIIKEIMIIMKNSNETRRMWRKNIINDIHFLKSQKDNNYIQERFTYAINNNKNGLYETNNNYNQNFNYCDIPSICLDFSKK